MSSRGRRAHKWALDFSIGGRLRSERAITQNPIGYVENINRSVDTRRGEDQNLLVKVVDKSTGYFSRDPILFFQTKAYDPHWNNIDEFALVRGHKLWSERKKQKLNFDWRCLSVALKSWEIALGPIKQIPMNFFIMWMAGNTISIFPIMMVGMMFFRPIQAFISVQNTFKMIEGDQSHLQKFVYLLGNLLCLGLAVYKCQVMGLLPSHASDWLAFVEAQKMTDLISGFFHCIGLHALALLFPAVMSGAENGMVWRRNFSLIINQFRNYKSE